MNRFVYLVSKFTQFSSAVLQHLALVNKLKFY